MIPADEAVRIMQREAGDAVVCLNYVSNRLWGSFSQDRRMEIPVGASMGKASSVGLGIALARPDHKVLVVDGDGALLMNLGSLVTIANMAPRNLYYVVLHDNVYYTTGGQPIPGAHLVDFATIAKGAGFPNAYTFEDVERFAGEFRTIFHQPGPTFIALKVYNPEPMPRPAVPRRFGVAIREVREALLNKAPAQL